MNVGIVSYGVYIPSSRLKTAEIASVWGKNPSDIEKSLGVVEKSVAGLDEDTVTQAYEAGMQALAGAKISGEQIDLCLVGSESHPYAVNPTSTIVGEFLQLGHKYLAADLEFACKAATSGMITTAGLIESGKINYGLVIGSDTAQAKPHDVLEYTAAAAAAAFIFGSDKAKPIARLVDFASFSSDTPDFWRRDGMPFPCHGGRFTGEPAYFTHVIGASRLLLDKLKMKPSQFSHCIFHMPNGKFPREVARRLGFTPEQQKDSLIIDHIGNPYTASSLLGLAAVLDVAKPGERIFLTSYGSGAGADSFVFETTKYISQKRNKMIPVADFIRKKRYISYVNYLKYRGKI